MTRFLALLFLLPGALLACSPTTTGEVVRPEAPTAAQALEPDTAVACDPLAELSPLTVDLSSSTRVALESAMKRGVAIIAHDCRQLRVLEGCRLGGDYEFAGVSRKEDVVTLKDESELGANLPFDAAKLSGKLAQGNSIQLALVQVGTRRALFDAVGRPELSGACDGATHFVRGTTLGAFAMKTSAKGEAQVAAEVFGVGAEAQSKSQRSTDRKDGSLSACRASKPDAFEPPAECGVPVRLHLVPILEKSPERGKGGKSKSKAGSNDSDGPPGQALNDFCPADFKRVRGKCTRAEGGPYLCKADDEAGCRKQCDAGDPGSCYNLGVLLQKQHGEWANREQSPEEKKRTWEQIVQENDAKRAKYRPLFVKACKEGIARACDRLYWMKGADAERQAAIQRACDLGYGPSCSMAAGKYFYHQETLDLAKGRERLKRGCHLGSRGGCMRLIDSYFNPPDRSQPTPGDLKAAEATLERLCLANDSGACWQIADRRLEGKGLTKDVGLALAYFDRACALGDLLACFGLGKRYFTGDGIGASTAQAARYFDLSCPLEKPERLSHCASIGRFFRSGKDTKKDPEQALIWLGRGCRHGGLSSCLALAEMYEAGEGTDKNEDRALELYERGCSEGAPMACLAQIRMLKSRDKAKALELSREGCKQGHFGYCDLVREIAGRDALKVFEEDCSDTTGASCLELGKLLERRDPKRAYRVMKKLCPDGSGYTHACDAVKRLARYAE